MGVLLFLLAAGVFPQANSVLLGTEIQLMDRKLQIPGISPAERKQALVKMARLFELSGNVKGAAEAWTQAAGAVPGTVDQGALLRGAVFLAAMGEFEKAAAEAAPLLGSSDRALAGRARVLYAQCESFGAGETGALWGLLADPALAGHKPAVYYSIWRISGDAAARNRLTAEFPQSPEARMVLDNAAVSAAPTALWLLMGVQPLPEPGSARREAGASPAPAAPAAAAPAAPAAAPAAAGSGGAVMLQTGLFGREENARAMAERLRAAGFSPVVAKKTVQGKENWAVGVIPGPDLSRTVLLLKDRGFESFPVY